MAKSAADRAEARVRQLCSLGLGREAVVSALLKELHMVIPSCSGNVYLADEKGGLANLYSDTMSPVLQSLYLEEIYCKREKGYSFPERIKSGSGVRDSEEIMVSLGSDLKAWRRSDHYNLTFRPLGRDFALELVVRDRCRVPGLALLYLHRGPSERWFSPAEKRRLLGLEGFLALAFARSSDNEGPLIDSGRTGLIVCSRDGEVLHFSSQGRRLLFLATYPRVAPGIDFSGVDALPAPLVQLCRDLTRIFHDDLSASAPAYSCRNVWGGFTFRAQWLEGAGSSSGFIAITISHQEPLLVRLAQSIDHFRLSRRQAEVCLLIATGASIERVAERLGISKHTVVAHGRGVYAELEVHNRAELVTKLLAVAA
jgi:DNA-binding CsgD family transcriptional regulator